LPLPLPFSCHPSPKAEDPLLVFVFAKVYPHATLAPMHFDDHQYYVYILASRSRTLYIGVTNNLLRRIAQHRQNKASSFTSRYKTHRLVYYERFQYVNNAIAREKYLKHFTREEKTTLIETTNPTWEDIAVNAFPPSPIQTP
jgi:putative endonuclease